MGRSPRDPESFIPRTSPVWRKPGSSLAPLLIWCCQHQAVRMFSAGTGSLVKATHVFDKECDPERIRTVMMVQQWPQIIYKSALETTLEHCWPILDLPINSSHPSRGHVWNVTIPGKEWRLSGYSWQYFSFSSIKFAREKFHNSLFSLSSWGIECCQNAPGQNN